MTRILMSIILMISMVIISCANQPPPIMTPEPIPTPIMVDKQVMLMEPLKRFNKTSNNYLMFMRGTNDIYEVLVSDENTYQSNYLNSKIAALSLKVYNDAILNWTPPESEYYDALIEIKEAELYRIEHFSNLTDLMLMALMAKDIKAAQSIHQQFREWQHDPRNRKASDLQNVILEELKIDAESVDFIYKIPKQGHN